MLLGELVDKTGLERLTPELRKAESEEVKFCHASDNLSEVLSNAPDGSILLTVQASLYTLAVAVLKKITAVVFTSGTRPDRSILKRAVEESMPLYTSTDTVFNLAGRLYALGLRGGYGKIPSSSS